MMRGRFLSLFNRAVSAVSSWSHDRPKEPSEQIGDALSSLTVDTIRRVYRNQLNRGEFMRPCFAFHEAARVCPIIVDKVSFWTASITGLDWSIHQTGFDKKDDEQKTLAERQAKVLRAAYDQMDVKAALRHLALAKFYGFSVLVRKGYRLEPLDWWNLLRDGRYGDWYWNGDLRKTSVFRNPGDAEKLPIEQMVLREVEDNLLLVALSIFFEYDKLNNWWNLNLEQESKRQVVILAGNGILDKRAFETAAMDVSDGKSGFIEKGGYSGGPTTEVIFPPASRGLGNFDIRAKVLDETLTKALTGGVLSMLTAPGSGTLAGSAHTETLHTIIGAEAAAISAILQDQYDRPILEEAGLLKPNERPLAWFELTNRRIIDPGTIITWTAQLATAQYRIDLDELSERTGMKLIEAPTQPQDPTGRAPMLPDRGAGLDLPNNCGTGDGGFQEGNTCGGKGSGSLKFASVEEARQQFDRDWPEFQNPTRRAPPRVSPPVARQRLANGLSVVGQDGKSLEFPADLETHWKDKPAREIEDRLSDLPMAVEAARSGKKYMLPGGKVYVLAAFKDERRGGVARAALVIAPDGKTVQTYWTQSAERLQRRDIRNREKIGHDETPSPDDLPGYAASGTESARAHLSISCENSTRDDEFLQYVFDAFRGESTVADLANRVAEAIGVPESWLGPVRKLLTDIPEKAPAEITPEYIESTLAEVKARLPELFDEMDIDAFASVLEEGMGASALEGVRDAIRKRANA